MSTYKEIVGQKITKVTSDPSDPKTGQMWYNETTGSLRALAILEAWSSGGPVTNARFGCGAADQGSQTSSLIFGGYTPSFTSTTEEYNGSGFSSGGALPAAVADNKGCGTQTAALSFMGLSNPSTHIAESFEYDGSTWGSETDLNTARYDGGGNGTQTAGLAFGGYTTTTSNATEEYDGSSWTSVNNMNTGRYSFGHAGVQTSAVAVTGVTTTRVANTEEYDGTNWTTGTNYPATLGGLRGFGATNTAAIFAGGTSSPPTLVTTCNSYDGTSFSSVPALANSASAGGTGGSNTAGLYMSGIRTAPGTAGGDTEEYNRSTNVITGAAFSSLTGPSSPRYGAGTGGTPTAAFLAAGFGTPGGSQEAKNEHYNGTSWSEQADLNSARFYVGGAGTQTATLIFGGRITPSPPTNNLSEEFDGSSWTEGNNLNTARQFGGACGTQTAALATGGNPSSNANEEYDGTSWTTVGTYPASVNNELRTTGTQTAAFGVGGPSSSTATNTYDGTNWTSAPAIVSGVEEGNLNGTTSNAIHAGGKAGSTNYTTASQIYDTVWFTGATLGTGRAALPSGPSSTTSINNSLIFGGPLGAPTYQANQLEEYNPETITANIETFGTE